MYRKKYKTKNGYSIKTNQLVGSLTYMILHGLVFFIAYELWGWKMFDEIYFYLMHIIAFLGVKFLLRDIVHFWKY